MEMEMPPNYPHIVVCPSVGIGHLTPFLRLSSMIAGVASSSNSIRVTLIIIRPTISLAESNQLTSFLSTHPHIHSLDFHALPSPPDASIHDAFLRQYHAVSLSAHLLTHHISALTPPPSAVISDLMLASGLNPALARLGIPNFTFITTSARFFSLMASLPHLGSVQIGGDVEIQGLGAIPGDEVPSMMGNKNHVFTQIIETNCRHLGEAKGIVINSFEFFEKETLSALHCGEVLSHLPPIFPIGPLCPLGLEIGCSNISWLDDQPSKSVVFVSFGSRTAMNKDQIRELGEGLERSGMRFLWVIKTTKVDKEDTEDLRHLLGAEYFDRTKERGLVIKEWVNQEEFLSHPAIGGFLTHCGWNSVIEAAQRGIPLLAWPLHGDQRVNAGVVEKAGLGVWERRWGWGGERLIKSEEIADKIKDMMTSEKLRNSSEKVGEEARKAWKAGGSSRKMFETLIDISK